MSQQCPPLTAVALDPQLSLFVIFEKKVGVIRLFNSTVGKVNLFEEPAPQNTHELTPSSSVSLSTLSASPGSRSEEGCGARVGEVEFGGERPGPFPIYLPHSTRASSWW